MRRIHLVEVIYLNKFLIDNKIKSELVEKTNDIINTKNTFSSNT